MKPNASPLTKKLNNGVEVVAKISDGELCAKTFVNKTQAKACAAKLGEGYVVRSFGRPFYVCKVE